MARSDMGPTREYTFTWLVSRRKLPRLLDASCWFEVTPLPEALWRITIKDEPHPVSICDGEDAQ